MHGSFCIGIIVVVVIIVVVGVAVVVVVIEVVVVVALHRSPFHCIGFYCIPYDSTAQILNENRILVILADPPPLAHFHGKTIGFSM